MRSIFWIALGLLLGVFDYTFAQCFMNFGLMPSLLFLTVVLTALLENLKTSIIVGFILGLSADAMTANLFGTKTIAFAIIAVVIISLRRNARNYSVLLLVVATVIATIIAAISTFVFANYYDRTVCYSDYLLRWYLPFVLCNIVVMPIFAFIVKYIHRQFVKYID